MASDSSYTPLHALRDLVFGKVFDEAPTDSTKAKGEPKDEKVTDEKDTTDGTDTKQRRKPADISHISEPADGKRSRARERAEAAAAAAAKAASEEGSGEGSGASA